MSDQAHFRGGARKGVYLKVHFRRDEPGAAFEQTGRTADVGLSGVFVETDRPPAAGTALVLRLVAPSAWDPLVLRAEVRWISEGQDGRPRGFGARFRQLARTDAQALYALLEASGFGGEDT